MLAFIASFAAVLLFGVVASLLSGEREGPAGSAQSTFGGLLGSIIGLLPDGFDPEEAIPLLTLDGGPEEIAAQYLETRIPTIGAGVADVEEQDGYTLLKWAWGRLLNPDQAQAERGQSGWLLLRPFPQGYEVIAATTEGVDLSDLSISEGALKGVVESDTDEFIGADVLTLDGWPVDSAPYPDGFNPDAAFLWGTGGASSPPLALNIPVSEPVIVRVNRVGGTLLSISEVGLGAELAPEDVAQGIEHMPGRALTDEQFEEVFGNEEPGAVIRESAFLAHSRDLDGLGMFGLYGARANSAGGVDFEQPVDCIVEYGLDGGVGGSQCGPDISMEEPGVALSSSCADPNVTMLSIWAINPDVEVVELAFSDGSEQVVQPNRGYLIWAWQNTTQLAAIHMNNASPEVQQAIDDHELPIAPCD